MTELEPVAWMDDGTTRNGSETTSFRVVHADTKATMPRASSENFTVALVRLSDAEELEARLTSVSVMKDAFQAAFCRVTRELEAAEALLKEAGEALKPFAEALDSSNGDERDGSPIWETSCAMAIDFRHLRAARSLMSKIGERNGE
jgi:hypothetical protein